MSHVIHKFVLGRVPGPQVIKLPLGAEIIHGEEQNDRIAVWFRANPTLGVTRRTFEVVVTGEEFDEQLVFHGTVQLTNGQFVVHVLERR